MAVERQRRLSAVALLIVLSVGGALAPTPAKPAPQDTAETGSQGAKDEFQCAYRLKMPAGAAILAELGNPASSRSESAVERIAFRT